MPAQEPVFSFPSSAKLNVPAEHFLDESEHPAHSHCHIDPRPSWVGLRNLQLGMYLHPGVAFDSTTLFDWTTSTSAVLTPHAEPLPMTDYNGEAVPDRSERSSHSTLSHQCSQWSRGNDYVDAHARLADFTGLDTRFFSTLQTDLRCTRKLEQGQKQEQLLVAKLNEVTSLQGKLRP